MSLPYNAPVKRQDWYSTRKIVDSSNREIFEIQFTSRDLMYEKIMDERLNFLVDLLNGKKSVLHNVHDNTYDFVMSDILEINKEETNLVGGDSVIEQKLEQPHSVMNDEKSKINSFLENAKNAVNEVFKKKAGRPKGSFGKKKLRAMKRADMEKVNA